MSIGLQYQSSFYKPKTYKDMEETLFKLTRAITDTGTDTVSSEGGTITYRITSLKRKLVNGKVVSTSTPSCTLGSASVSWAIWGGVTVGDGHLDVKINYSKNTGSSMQGWEILLLLLFPVALIIFLVFLPFYVFHKYSSREEDKKYEEEHPEILKVDSYITCWYPWHRYSVAYTLALIFWVIAFIIGILS